ncbi:MAG TPA: TIGR03936 family radical SAM-associated protein [Planctomycetota bacterium]|nr:TIGR03936 family radical SAM-associated protein [Planctomycetota bacterium]
MRQRIRVSYRRTGDLRFLSQLDVVRTVERSVRRSGLKVAFSEGFNPRVRLSFSPALPTGVEAGRAWFDVLMEEPVTSPEVRDRLAASLPAGFEVLEVAPPETAGGALRPMVYEIRRADGAGAPIVRQTAESLRPEDLSLPGLLGIAWRPEGIEIQMEPGAGGARLRAVLAALGLAGPDAPPVVVRAALGDCALVDERTPDRSDGRSPRSD